jgi:hypothetical protein
MKKFGVKGKNAVSAVVATVLIIMITVAAVAILWITVIPMIENSLESTTAEKVQLEIVTSEGYTVWDAANQIVSVQVKRGNDKLNISGIDFNFVGDGKYEKVEESDFVLAGLTKVYTYTLTEITNLERISIAPITKEGAGAISSEVSPVKAAAVSMGLFRPTNFNVHECPRNYNDACGDDGSIFTCASGTFCTVFDWTCGWYSFPQGTRCTNGEIGSACTDDSDCFSGRCGDEWQSCGDPTCVTGNNVDACNANSDCDSGFCAYDQVITGCQVCTSGDLAAPCDDINDCKSELFCNTYNGVCTNGVIGDGCYSGADCASGICETYNYICKESKADETVCGSSSECDSNYCDTSTHQCKTPRLYDGLSFYYPMNETSGVSGAGLYSYVSTPTQGGYFYNVMYLVNQQGKVGRALGFNGGDDWIYMTTLPINLGYGSPFTVSFWTNMTGTINSGDGILGYYSTVYPNNRITFGDDGKLKLYDSANTLVITSNSVAVPNTWQQWTITRDSSNNIRIYLNGALDSTPVVKTNSFYFNEIGVWRGAPSQYGGTLDELTIWRTRQLSDSEISELYTLNSAGFSVKEDS